MRKHLSILIPVFSIFALTACQAGLPAERPLNQGDRPRVTYNTQPVEEVFPVLNVTQKDQKSEFKMRSQTSRYLNSSNTELEITLSSSAVAFCKNEAPTLKEGEEQLKFIIKSKDGKTPVGKTEFAKNEAYEISIMRKTPTLDTKIPADSLESFKITDLNNAIVRGHLKIAATDLTIEGEFFTAICK